MTCLLLILSACQTTRPQSNSICATGVMPFSAPRESLQALPQETKDNLALLNCTLWKYCGYAVPNEKKCKELTD